MNFLDFDSDSYPQKAVALRLSGLTEDKEIPFHSHIKGQLVLTLSGFVRCNIENAIWLVPPNCAVWIPSQVIHSNIMSYDADTCMLFIDPDIVGLPSHACTLSISSLLQELIIRLTVIDQFYDPHSPTGRLVDVLIDELTMMPSEDFNFPIPRESRLNKIALAMLKNPGDRRTIRDWAFEYAMSERTLARLVKQETGLTFGAWRSQLHIVIALQKLLSGESVQIISEELGYESTSAFIAFFRKIFGQSPKQYIKLRSIKTQK